MNSFLLVALIQVDDPRAIRKIVNHDQDCRKDRPFSLRSDLDILYLIENVPFIIVIKFCKANLSIVKSESGLSRQVN